MALLKDVKFDTILSNPIKSDSSTYVASGTNAVKSAVFNRAQYYKIYFRQTLTEIWASLSLKIKQLMHKNNHCNVFHENRQHFRPKSGQNRRK
jgi:hypothetical protein